MVWEARISKTSLSGLGVSHWSSKIMRTAEHEHGLINASLIDIIDLYRYQAPMAPIVFDYSFVSGLWAIQEKFPLSSNCTDSPGKDLVCTFQSFTAIHWVDFDSIGFRDLLRYLQQLVYSCFGSRSWMETLKRAERLDKELSTWKWYSAIIMGLYFLLFIPLSFRIVFGESH